MATDPEAALVALELRRAEAIGAGDLETLAAILADDYRHVLGTGGVVDKVQYLEMIRRGPRKPERGALQVRAYGDTAVITGDLDNQLGAPGDAQRLVRTYCTQVAVRRDGTWRFVSCILTPKRAAP